MSHRTDRRRFLQATGLAGASLWAGAASGADAKSPNEKLNIAVIGCGGMGAGAVNGARRHNLVALCDVDESRAAKAFDENPTVPKFRDFRKMLDDLVGKIDAVFVATPDHVHAPAAIAAIRLGKHVYCEKPLAHSVYEARLMAAVAAEKKVATQMGNQGHSSAGCRSLVEAVRSGVIGAVREAHAWCPKNFSARSRPADTPEVPKTLHWDLWVGPAPMRPYHPAYLPFNWRGRWDFGTGGLGDMACHVLDPVFWALDLDHPATVEATGEPAENPEGFAADLTVRYQFAKRGDGVNQGPVTVYWHHGGHIPDKRPFADVKLPADFKMPGEGVLLIGEKGMLIGDRGPGIIALLPRDAFADYKAPAVAKPAGHHDEWFAACKGGPPALSNFGYAAKLTETVLLGNVAWRVGKKLEWDGRQGKATNCPEADQYIRREYRKGWEL